MLKYNQGTQTLRKKGIRLGTKRKKKKKKQTRKSKLATKWCCCSVKQDHRINKLRGGSNHSDDAAKFVAVTSFLLGVVPRVLASLDMASIVITGRLSRCRWDAGVDCVRPWCGPFIVPPRAAAGVDEPDRKPFLPPRPNA